MKSQKSTDSVVNEHTRLGTGRVHKPTQNTSPFTVAVTKVFVAWRSRAIIMIQSFGACVIYILMCVDSYHICFMVAICMLLSKAYGTAATVNAC